MTRRQFGAIRRLPSGRWQARYREPSGQMVTAPSTFSTKGDASRWLAVTEADLIRGQYVDPRAGRIPLGQWADDGWPRPASVPTVSPETAKPWSCGVVTSGLGR